MFGVYLYVSLCLYIYVEALRPADYTPKESYRMSKI
jgi:hypothetical protein